MLEVIEYLLSVLFSQSIKKMIEVNSIHLHNSKWQGKDQLAVYKSSYKKMTEA